MEIGYKKFELEGLSFIIEDTHKTTQRKRSQRFNVFCCEMPGQIEESFSKFYVSSGRTQKECKSNVSQMIDYLKRKFK